MVMGQERAGFYCSGFYEFYYNNLEDLDTSTQSIC